MIRIGKITICKPPFPGEDFRQFVIENGKLMLGEWFFAYSRTGDNLGPHRRCDTYERVN